MSSLIRNVACTAICLLPASRWKNRLLSRIPGWSIHDTARLAPIVILNVRELVIGGKASVAIGCFIRNVDRVELGYCSRIGPGNSINSGPDLTRYVSKPRSYMELGDHGIVTWRHYIDCSGGFSMESFSILAGRQSVVLTHSVDIWSAVSRISPVHIGRYCFIGTNCRIMPGATIGDKIVVGAGSVVAGDLSQSESLYAGAPAIVRRSLAGAAYFRRKSGPVWPEGHPDAVQTD